MSRERQMLLAFLALLLVHAVLMAIALRSGNEPRVSFPLSSKAAAKP